jgi:hypothetical protein
MADQNRWHGGLKLLNPEDRLGVFKELSQQWMFIVIAKD